MTVDKILRDCEVFEGEVAAREMAERWVTVLAEVQEQLSLEHPNRPVTVYQALWNVRVWLGERDGERQS